MAAEPCPSCEQIRRELHAVQDRLGLLTQGVAACVALLNTEQANPSMAKHRVLALVHHRLNHLTT